ncbi:hypothetical protein BVRB_017990 [Beta vulgaris subsp. vulgaris]|uniref:Uncharacterized protein n=1 Tax=Beta vulgaris subsp. vulgaris TaxID=3555 RepID=A0A0J7YM26_BETVV|nr:hypothetical protein BVRB_017990 [Beta vulgaris subsp. vulgaris]
MIGIPSLRKIRASERFWEPYLAILQIFRTTKKAMYRYMINRFFISSLLKLQAVQPTEEMIHKEKEEKNFSNGSLVEVSSDEDDSQGVHWL